VEHDKVRCAAYSSLELPVDWERGKQAGDGVDVATA
jgi:hypothetical protein